MKSSMQESNTPALRFGHVTEYDPSRHMARVNFPDLGLTSYWLPILTHNTLKNHDETHLDIGEHVACMMSGDGAEMGVILGAFYDDKNTPPVADADVRAVTFGDGVRVLYNRKHHELVIDCPEYVCIEASDITRRADTITDNASTITHSADKITHSAETITQSAESVNISASSFSLSGGSGGNAGITGRHIKLTGESVEIHGNIALSGMITLSGEVTCPGYCHCGG